jgi:SulP family sulfate permease
LPDVLILEMHQVINLDTTGLDALESLHKVAMRQGGRLILANLNAQPLSLIQRSHFAEAIGSENIVASLDLALETATRPS